MATTEADCPLPTTTANVAHSDNNGKACVFSVDSKNGKWIINTGASDHMTNNPHQLQSIKSSSQSIISTANGSASPVTGEGPVTLSDTLTLDTVLVVLSLSYNLLSVSQITQTLSCTVPFWLVFCIFLDILTRQILGCGVRRGQSLLFGYDKWQGKADRTGTTC